MTRRSSLAAALALALAGAACSGGVSARGATLRQPVAVAFFDGLTTKLPGVVHRYLAVAAFGGNELHLVDPSDDNSVIGPGLVFPLSVPTAPGPTFVVGTDLGDAPVDANGVPTVLRPGLLAVASQQTSSAGGALPTLVVEVVRTWNPLTTVVPSRYGPGGLADPLPLSLDLVYELAGVDPTIVDAQLVSLLAMPVPGQPGRACLLAGLSGGRLAVVTYERDPTRQDDALRRVPGLPAQLVLLRTATAGNPSPGEPFDALAMDLAPIAQSGAPVDAAGTRRVFVATTDPLGDRTGAVVQGVAQLVTSFQASGGPAAWTMVGLDALGPTRLVASQLVSERDMTLTPPSLALPSPDLLDGVMRLEVFAVLDEAGCGPHRAIDCGIVTLVPDDPTRNGIAADPVGELPYRAPMRVPGYALSMVAAAPRRAGEASVDAVNTPDPGPVPRFRVMNLAPGTGLRDGSAVLAVTSADGRIYLFDVSRFGAGTDLSLLRGDFRAGVVVGSAFSAGPAVPDLTATDPSKVTNPPGNKNYPVLTLWADYTSPPPAVKRAIGRTTAGLAVALDQPLTEANVKAPPGYAQSDSWRVQWRGSLPGLASALGELGLTAGGLPWVAAQQDGYDGSGNRVKVVSLRVGDPELGVRVQDYVDLDLPLALCPNAPAGVTSGRLRAQVVGFLDPAPEYPGGALVIDRVSDPATGAECPNPVVTPAAPLTDAYLTVRAQGFVLAGSAFGYAGRPEVSGTVDGGPITAADVDAQTFRLRWEDEAALQQAIDAAPTTDQRRPFQERLAVARKTRRNFYPADPVCGAGTGAVTDLPCDEWKAGFEPTTCQDVQTRPPPPADRYVLRFRLGVFCREQVPQIPCEALDQMQDDTGLFFSTRRGVVEWSRRPLSGGSLPRSIAWVDKSGYYEGGVTQLFSAFTDDQVIDFSPGASAAAITAIH